MAFVMALKLYMALSKLVDFCFILCIREYSIDNEGVPFNVSIIQSDGLYFTKN